jgi:H+/Cl- antiporter ClcA
MRPGGGVAGSVRAPGCGGLSSGAGPSLQELVSYVAGIPGGIFAPSLAVGAGLGGTLSLCLPYAPGGAIVLLTMAAYFAGVVQAPLTALVIVSEMTGNRDLTLPLMAVTLLGRGASALICRESLYRALAVTFIEMAPKPAAEIAQQMPRRPHDVSATPP